MKKERFEIKITISEKSQIFNDYNSDQLSNELSEYIYSQCKGTPVNKNININIFHKVELSNKEKERITDAIRSNFGVDIKETIMELKNEIIKELLLILAGTIILIISNKLNYINMNVIGEIVSIFACVIIWEAAYNSIFIDTNLRFKNKRLKRLVKSRINFIKIETMEKQIP